MAASVGFHLLECLYQGLPSGSSEQIVPSTLSTFSGLNSIGLHLGVAVPWHLGRSPPCDRGSSLVSELDITERISMSHAVSFIDNALEAGSSQLVDSAMRGMVCTSRSITEAM